MTGLLESAVRKLSFVWPTTEVSPHSAGYEGVPRVWPFNATEKLDPDVRELLSMHCSWCVLDCDQAQFSGLARAIIHNSDYASVEAARDAIDLYFSQRNEHFSKHPKRAGQKIWGKERVPSEFAEGQNCKDPLYQYATV
jgi:hypothetical protein